MSFAIYALAVANIAIGTQNFAFAGLAFALNGWPVSLGQGLGAVWGSDISDSAALAWLGVCAPALALCGAALASRIPPSDPPLEDLAAPAADLAALGAPR